MKTIELILQIKERPFFFLRSYSIFEFDSFIRGYSFSQVCHKIKNIGDEDSFDTFKNVWLKNKFDLDGNTSYVQYLMFVSNNEYDALDEFFKLWSEYTLELPS